MSTPLNETIPNKAANPRTVIDVPTEEAYAQWASVYDTDGNFLQALDELEMERFLPVFLANSGIKLRNPSQTEESITRAGQHKRILDLGCGTGRTTLRLDMLADPSTTTILGVDNSRSMLDIARTKLNSSVASRRSDAAPPGISSFDINSPDPEALRKLGTMDAIVSTLVIEHIELDQYFQVATTLLKPGCRLVLTNMHSDMGRKSQANFRNEQGVRVQPKSIPHTLDEVAEVGKRYGLKVLKKAERAVTQELVTQLGPRSLKWVGTRCWYMVMFEKDQ